LKKFTSILILSLFIYNTLGFLAIHPILSMYYKYLGTERADKPSKEEMIELLIFNKEDIQKEKIDFRWIHSREFKYNGDMYDVVKTEEADGQLIVHCINDTKEKKLEKDFEREVEKNTSNKQQKSENNNPFKTLITEAVSELVSELAEGKKLKYGFNYVKNYVPVCAEIPSPPPKVS
jgi:hypothetical protein